MSWPIVRIKRRWPRPPALLAKKDDFGLELRIIWLGFTAALGIWFLASVLALLWIAFRGTGSYWFALYTYLSGILGVFLGSMLAGNRSAARGWLHGLLVGLLLGIFGLAVNLELVPRSFYWLSALHQLVVWSMWGTAGGYLGHHFKPISGSSLPGKGKAGNQP